MTATPLTAGLSLLIVLLLFGTAANVGRARSRHGVEAPAMTGPPAFERAVRVQMNTLEWAVMVLPCLWLAAGFVSDSAAAAVGGLWLAARVVYAVAYQCDPRRRGPAFLVSALAFGALGLMAGFGVLRSLFGA